MYANGAHCGKTVILKNTETGHTERATVADSCPTCVSPQSVDMSSGLFNQFAAFSQGTFNRTQPVLAHHFISLTRDSPFSGMVFRVDLTDFPLILHFNLRRTCDFTFHSFVMRVPSRSCTRSNEEGFVPCGEAFGGVFSASNALTCYPWWT
jgi:hypothetical protein